MDIAGLIFGVIGVVKPLAETAVSLCEVSQSVSHFGSDLNALRVRVAVAQRQTSTFEAILLKEKRFNWLSGSLFQELSPSQQQEFYDLFQGLKQSLILFVEQAKACGIGIAPRPVVKRLAGADVQIIDGTERAGVYQKSASVGQKLSWSVKDKKAMTGLVEDIEHWTSLLRLTIQDLLSSFPGFRELSRLDDLGRSLDEQASDLKLALAVRRIFVTKPADLAEPAVLITNSDIAVVSTCGGGGSSTLGVFTPDQSDIYIETKLFATQVGAAEDQRRLAKVKQLATLLKHATEPHLRVLNARGYSYDPLGQCASIIYTIPGTLAPRPVSLHQLYAMKLREARPPLETRFQLAVALVEVLFSLHSLGWVHKSFSSLNILFFPRKSQSQSQSASWRPTVVGDRTRSHSHGHDGHGHDHGRNPRRGDQDQGTENTSIRQLLRHAEMKLVGFELARPEAEQSSLSPNAGDGDRLAYFYRHPTRWRAPTESFTALHDLYSLGAVLLEIGLWQRLDHLLLGQGDRHRTGRTRTDHDPGQVKEVLLQHATRRLPYTMGSKYAAVVCAFLKGRFEEGLDDSSDTDTPTGADGPFSDSATWWAVADPSHVSNRVLVLKELHKASNCL
ncbi:hypothetical protein PV08_02360 [Exophiala spinifera]|uniref:Protein kinase domain-containing protein n=1 Tax=Exophiala spinifera TaxID=91928 RepID=A0A0D2BGG9_9EURO|nr:uncharacterized protein PV08_02360 [Exophiala spinifera]KIW18073.1 hypothetical protein PV08_02360 [Exophiala spinifera]